MKDYGLGNGLPSRTIAEGATLPNPGYAASIWSSAASKILTWNGTSWTGIAGAKDVKSRLSSNASGVWTKTYPANFWSGEPTVSVSPISASVAGQIGWKVSKTLSNNIWTVAITFTVVPPQFTIVVGAVINTVVAAGTVLFDYAASEANTI